MCVRVYVCVCVCVHACACVCQVGSAGAVIAPILMVNTVGSKGLLNLIGVMVVMANITFFFLTTFRTQDIKSK